MLKLLNSIPQTHSRTRIGGKSQNYIIFLKDCNNCSCLVNLDISLKAAVTGALRKTLKTFIILSLFIFKFLKIILILYNTNVICCQINVKECSSDLTSNVFIYEPENIGNTKTRNGVLLKSKRKKSLYTDSARYEKWHKTHFKESIRKVCASLKTLLLNDDKNVSLLKSRKSFYIKW